MFEVSRSANLNVEELELQVTRAGPGLAGRLRSHPAVTARDMPGILDRAAAAASAAAAAVPGRRRRSMVTVRHGNTQPEAQAP